MAAELLTELIEEVRGLPTFYSSVIYISYPTGIVELLMRASYSLCSAYKLYFDYGYYCCFSSILLYISVSLPFRFAMKPVVDVAR